MAVSRKRRNNFKSKTKIMSKTKKSKKIMKGGKRPTKVKVNPHPVFEPSKNSLPLEFTRGFRRIQNGVQPPKRLSPERFQPFNTASIPTKAPDSGYMDISPEKEIWTPEKKLAATEAKNRELEATFRRTYPHLVGEANKAQEAIAALGAPKERQAIKMSKNNKVVPGVEPVVILPTPELVKTASTGTQNIDPRTARLAKMAKSRQTGKKSEAEKLLEFLDPINSLPNN